MLRRNLPVLFGVLLLAELGCTNGSDDDGFSSFNPTLSTSVTLTNGDEAETDGGDGDGDSGDGDGDDSGDGDGDDSGDGDGDSGDGDGDSGDGDGEPGCDWMPHPDQSPNAECDPILQDCPVGEKCVAYASGVSGWDNNKCVPVTGNQAVGEPCIIDNITSSMDNCDEHGQCFNLDNDNNGTCLAFCGCTYEEPACSVGTNCLIGNDASIALCVERCDPLAQDCPPGEACYPSGETLLCSAVATNLPPGQPCGYINDCAAGTACYQGIAGCAGACCTPFCDIDGDDSECAVLPGTVCEAVYGWAVCG